jgi:hypothetical protein
MFHDSLGHAGVEQTLRVLHFHFHWVGIKRDVASYVASCNACQKVKASLPEPPPLQPPVIYGPLSHVHMD